MNGYLIRFGSRLRFILGEFFSLHTLNSFDLDDPKARPPALYRQRDNGRTKDLGGSSSGLRNQPLTWGQKSMLRSGLCGGKQDTLQSVTESSESSKRNRYGVG
jgi:hypothetical protein